MTKLDAKSILQKHQAEDDRVKTSIYVSGQVWKDFKKACSTAPTGKVIEELMKNFIEDLKTGKGPK